MLHMRREIVQGRMNAYSLCAVYLLPNEIIIIIIIFHVSVFVLLQFGSDSTSKTVFGVFWFAASFISSRSTGMLSVPESICTAAIDCIIDAIIYHSNRAQTIKIFILVHFTSFHYLLSGRRVSVHSFHVVRGICSFRALAQRTRSRIFHHLIAAWYDFLLNFPFSFVHFAAVAELCARTNQNFDRVLRWFDLHSIRISSSVAGDGIDLSLSAFTSNSCCVHAEIDVARVT